MATENPFHVNGANPMYNPVSLEERWLLRWLLKTRATARDQYDRFPCYYSARKLYVATTEVVAISDDYQGMLDEAVDILAEHV